MRWEQQIQYATISDIGFRRQNNQDACVVQICSDQEVWMRSGHLFVVADGMGGHAVGELASKIAVDTIPHSYFKTKTTNVPQALKAAIHKANAAIYERGTQNDDFNRMGTTCVSLVLSSKGAVAAHVGDSRLYRIRKDRIDQLTFDHSLQWELLRRGNLKPEEIFLHESRHVITRSLGPEETVEVDLEGPYPILPGDIYLLCSDGLTGHINDAEIGAIAKELPVGDACRLLVNLANLRGGSDNITVVIARIGELPGGLTVDNEEDEANPSDGLGWRWLAAVWAVAIMFALGVSLALLGNTVAGSVIASMALAVALVLSLKGTVNRSKQTGNNPDNLDKAAYGKAYRTASARLMKAFLNQLAALESSLQQSSLDEGWQMDRKKHESGYAEAKMALAENQHTRALKGFAKAIDAMMAGVQSQRKKLDHQAKWGKSSPSPHQEAEG